MLPSQLGLLVVLDALLETRSVTKAARKMGLSTPAMSQTLSRLREALNDPILVRAGREMVPTPRAEALRPEVAALVRAAGRLFSGSSDAPVSTPQSFTILATDHPLTVSGSSLDALIRAEAPGTVLRFLPTTDDDASLLRSGDVDLAIGIYGALPPEILTRRLFTESLVCVVRRGHPRVGEVVTEADLEALEHVQVVPRGAPGGYVDEVLAEHGIARRVTRAVPFFVSGLMLVASTDLMLIGPERVARALAPNLGLRVLPPPFPLRPYCLNMIWHPRTDESPGHRWLRNAFLRAAQEAAPEVHEGARVRLDPTDPTGGPESRRLRRRRSPPRAHSHAPSR